MRKFFKQISKFEKEKHLFNFYKFKYFPKISKNKNINTNDKGFENMLNEEQNQNDKNNQLKIEKINSQQFNTKCLVLHPVLTNKYINIKSYPLVKDQVSKHISQKKPSDSQNHSTGILSKGHSGIKKPTNVKKLFFT